MNLKPLRLPTCLLIIAATILPLSAAIGQTPFTLRGPGVQSRHYRITTFADGLNYPVGMAWLDDGSMLVAETRQPTFFGSRQGRLVRLADNDGDGVADVRQTLFDGLPSGRMSDLQIAGDLVFATGQGEPISILRLGNQPSDPLTMQATLELQYPGGGWLHPHSALAVRSVSDNEHELYFQLGSDTNFNETTRQVRLAASSGLQAQLSGDAIHRITVQDLGNHVQLSDVQQIATGLRNAAGMTFDPTTGDLLLQDNGIDGVTNANEPTSADEINRILADDLGRRIADFGFPDHYIEYRTGDIIGQGGELPLVDFQPLPDPMSGDEAEGPNDIVFGPEMFPLPLRWGLFVGMHGRFGSGGVVNEENPVVFVDLRDNSYFRFIGVDEPLVGHLDGLLASANSLFLADISPSGTMGNAGANTGRIYRIESLIPSIDELTRAVRDGNMATRFDLNSDGVVNQRDRLTWITEINQSYFGDANLDGKFSSEDLVHVLQGGKYSTGEEATWGEGDWNGDGVFSSRDFLPAFQSGAYEQGLRTKPAPAVPEPNSAILAWMACMLSWRKIRSSATLISSSRLP